MATGGVFLGVKQLGCEFHHLSPSGAGAKNVWSCTSTPIQIHGKCLSNGYIFRMWYLVNHRDNFTFTSGIRKNFHSSRKNV
jgi:hypothetical protein